MSNFDFLNADDSGKSGPPQPMEVRAPRYPIWSWTINLSQSNGIYCVVCLTDNALFVRSEDKRPGDPSTDLSRLVDEDPDVVFQRDFIRIPLDSIQRFRFHVYYAWLDVIRDDGSRETICDFETQKTELIFEALHERLAPHAPIESEGVRVEREIVLAVAIFIPIALIAGLFLAASLASDEKLAEMGRSHFGIMLVKSMGATTVTMLSVAAILAGLAFIAHKVFFPTKALAVIVKRLR